MNEITITGNVVAEPRHSLVSDNTPITSFRMAHNYRYQDRASGQWVDGATTYIDVSCWRTMAENVHRSVGKGSPVIVVGRLRSTERVEEATGKRRMYYEIDATAVGVNLARVATAVVPTRSEAVDRQEAHALAEVHHVDAAA